MNLVQMLSAWLEGSSIDDIRRVLTPLFITLDLILVGVFVAAAWVHWDAAPYRSNLVVQASMALGTYFFGQLLTRVWGWFILYTRQEGGGVLIAFDWDIVLIFALIGSLISIVGAAWAAYVFTPSNWKAGGWLVAAVAVALFLALTRFF